MSRSHPDDGPVSDGMKSTGDGVTTGDESAVKVQGQVLQPHTCRNERRDSISVA